MYASSLCVCLDDKSVGNNPDRSSASTQIPQDQLTCEVRGSDWAETALVYQEGVNISDYSRRCWGNQSL